MTMFEWRDEIRKYFPEYVTAAEIGLSVICQLRIKDITNPFGLVYVDVPSSGKTIVLNFFSELKDIVYPTDSISAASFVSQAANRKTEDLDKIDLLPKIKGKVLMVRDLAPIFGSNDDDIVKTIGVLTRVFDGEGYLVEGGVHGSRGYSGDYLFMFLAATTPISQKVWKVMGNFGSRLFFLPMNTPDKEIQALADQVSSELSVREKEKICRQATTQFITSIWGEGEIAWRPANGEENLRREIAMISQLLAVLRTPVSFSRSDSRDACEEISGYVEKPDRINQLFYNFARGHAVLCRRSYINDVDVAYVLKIALGSAPAERVQAFNLLSEKGAVLAEDFEKRLGRTKPTILRQMKILTYLGLVRKEISKNGDVGCPPVIYKLTDKFQWFNSARFRFLLTGISQFNQPILNTRRGVYEPAESGVNQ